MHGVNLHLLIRVHLGKAPHVLEASQIRFEEMTLAGDEVCRGLGGGGGAKEPNNINWGCFQHIQPKTLFILREANVNQF